MEGKATKSLTVGLGLSDQHRSAKYAGTITEFVAHDARIQSIVKNVFGRFFNAPRVERIDIADAAAQHNYVRIEDVNYGGNAPTKLRY